MDLCPLLSATEECVFQYYEKGITMNILSKISRTVLTQVRANKPLILALSQFAVLMLPSVAVGYYYFWPWMAKVCAGVPLLGAYFAWMLSLSFWQNYLLCYITGILGIMLGLQLSTWLLKLQESA